MKTEIRCCSMRSRARLASKAGSSTSVAPHHIVVIATESPPVKASGKGSSTRSAPDIWLCSARARDA